MDPIKEAFLKAKQDISELRESMSVLQTEIAELKHLIQEQKSTTHSSEQQTDRHESSTDKLTEPYNMPLYSLKSSNTNGSSGNKGVPTNKQTNQQTNQQSNTHNLAGVLAEFDSVKAQLQTQFKSLTKQEMEVFASIYQLEDLGATIDYPSLANKLGLTETSIRDYTHKMMRKGIPIIKTKQNNKKIFLSIDPSLKKIAPLSSLMLLREI